MGKRVKKDTKLRTQFFYSISSDYDVNDENDKVAMV